jgi:hypothetical protein
MILPKSYVDSTSGVRPGYKQESFNNIVFLTWYLIARKQQKTLDDKDLYALKRHIDLNNDKDGLYIPKNSHDNVTYKMILSKVFGLNVTEDMNFFSAIKQIGFFRIWDVITYGSVFGPKLLRPLFKLFLFIPALQMVHAAKVPIDGKVRPKWIDGKHSRIFWWFFKTLEKEEKTPTQTIKHWITMWGSTHVSRHMQNDGKHITVFRLYALRNEFGIFKRTAKKVRKIYIEKYGEDYVYEILNNYFQDRNHPLIPMWKHHGDLLKEVDDK